ncbi:Gag polyprotein [Anthophora retusa]
MSAPRVAELKEKLRSMDLPTTGTKTELLNRLLEAGVPESDLRPITFAMESVEDASGQEELEMITRTTQGREKPTAERADERSASEIKLLSRERDLAEREIQLLRRELELARRETPASSSPSVSGHEARWTDVKDLLGDFDGSGRDIRGWENQIRKLIETYKLEDHAAKALVCHKLKGKALSWYHSREDCVEMTCDQLLRALRGMYGQRTNGLLLRREFEHRLWRVNETFADYVHDKIILGNRVPIPDHEIVDYLVDGIPDNSLRSLARVQRFRETEDLMEAFSGISLSGEPRRQKKIEHREELVSDAARTPAARGQQGAPEARRVRCFNCNGLGHFAADCRKPKRGSGTCYKCGDGGHRAEDCRSSPNEVNHVTQSKTANEEDNEFYPSVTLAVRDQEMRMDIEINALIDSGSPISFIKDNCVPRKFVQKLVESRKFSGINNSIMVVTGFINAKI